MGVGLIDDVRFDEHDAGPGHPERPARLAAAREGLRREGLWDRLERIDFEAADRAALERLHDADYVDRSFDACAAGESFLDSVDVGICPDSAAIAQRAAGGALAAADAVVDGRVERAFCLMRPPGHHAEADRAMGFCIFNSIALAADHLTRERGLERVAIVDFDVHHGNGTQHLLEDRGDVLFISMHEDPRVLYPGTGYAYETGTPGTPGEGRTLNVPLPPRSGDERYVEAMRAAVIPALEAFAPRVLLVSAGFDAAAADPLAHMEVTPDGFEALTRELVGAAGRLCDGRLVSLLEGGYDLDALSASVARHVGVLLNGR